VVTQGRRCCGLEAACREKKEVGLKASATWKKEERSGALVSSLFFHRNFAVRTAVTK
jgi:hypothetical protein